MKHLKRSVILFVFLLSGCEIRPPDGPVCRELKPIVIETPDAFGVITKLIRPNPVCAQKIRESTCGECVWTVSDRVQFVGENNQHWLDGDPWSVVKSRALLMPPKTQAKQKKFVLDICKKYPSNCDSAIPRWRVKVDQIFK